MIEETSWMERVQVYRAGDLADAQLVADLLEQNGIPVVQRGTSLSGLGGAIPIPDAMPTLWVVPHNAARARALIEAAESPPTGLPWTCRCGEANDANFGSCWSCGSDRPDLLEGRPVDPGPRA